MNPKPTTAYVPVPVEENLPKEYGRYFFLDDTTDDYREAVSWDGRDADIEWAKKNCTHWLEKKESVFVLTKEELEKEILDFAQWYSGMERGKVERALKRFYNEQKETVCDK